MHVTCERLDHKGRGVCHIDGKVIFVNNLLPKEQATIQITLNKKTFSLANVTKYTKYSIDRVKSNCPYNNCGCSLQNYKYNKQLEYKQNKVQDILKRYAGIDIIVNPIIPSSISNYRNKITLKVNNKVGYYHPQTNEFFKIDVCQIATTKTNQIIKILNTLDLTNVKEVTIKDFNDIMIIIDGTMDITSLKKHASSIYMNNKLVYGNKYIQTTILNYAYNVSDKAFFQVNKYMIDKLYTLVLNNLPKGNIALDLYCGTGTITLLLSEKFNKVIGIELNKSAVECANKNKAINKVNNVEFICDDASNFPKNIKVDALVVDPPRSGLNKQTITNILNIKPTHIVYVSCDVMTLARDLKILAKDYTIESITPVDMFPNTYHVECVVKLKSK